jgi:hypothetical protein
MADPKRLVTPAFVVGVDNTQWVKDTLTQKASSPKPYHHRILFQRASKIQIDTLSEKPPPSLHQET